MLTSVTNKVESGSKCFIVGDTNSDERKKPKKADVAAAHNMQRFKKDNLDVIKNWYNLRSKTGVKGYVMVFCFLYLFF